MKRLLLLFVLLFTVLFTYAVLAQEAGSVRRNYKLTIPEKIQKLVLDPLPAGTYSVGSGAYFPTIDSAFNKLSIDGIAGEVILELIDELYIAPTKQFGFSLNGPIPGAGQNSRVTIKPAENKNVIIEGNNEALLFLINTSYVTFDGVGLTGATALTIHALQNSAYVFNDALDFINNSDHNIIQNITFIVEDNTRASGAGFWFSQTGSFAPDSNLIQNNYVKKAGLALYIISSTSAVKGKGNIVRGNQIGSDSDSLVAFGIQVMRCENTIVENNVVQNLKSTISGTDQVQVGILSSICSGTIVRNNILGNFRATNGYSASGIFLGGAAGDTGNDNLIYNNMIYDIQSTSIQGDSRVTGIQIWYQNNPKVYYNSVYLSGNGTNISGSAALFIGSATGVDARNNILVNTRDESPYCASVIRIYSGSPLAISNFNNLYYEPNQYNCLVRVVGTDYHTLADWQATGKDLESITEMPNFIEPYLHIDKTFPTNLERGATPIATITTDFDGDLRNVTTPDIGADEFDGFTFEDPLPAGTYTVGTGGNFATIPEAFDKLETDGVAGPVTLELIDDLYIAPTDTFGFLLDGPITGAGPNSRITIKPAENKNVTLEGNWRFVITFRNVSYLTFDGISTEGSTTLTIHSLYNAQYVTNRGVGFLWNSDHNAVQNLIVICDDYLREGPGIFFQAADNSLFAADSNLIQNNFIKKAGCAIYVSSWAGNQNTRVIGNIIRGNKIGSETDSLIAWGIQLEKSQNAIVENNIVQNLKLNNGYIWENINIGINSYQGNGDIIRNNVVHNIKASGGYTGVGILLSGEGSWYGNNNLVFNNMVYDIQSASTQSDSRVAGIQVWMQQNPKIYYNSVYLSGIGANQFGSGALYIWNTCTNVELKNNILVNTRDESPSCASVIYIQGGHSILSISDYNDLYFDETITSSCLVRAGGDYETLAYWQQTGKDSNSVTEMPNFISPYLHIDGGLSTLLDNGATPISGIDTDFDGQTRNSTTPDIGADEFTIVGVEDETTLPTEYALEQNYPNPFNPTTRINYQIPELSFVTIKVYDVLGNEIAELINEEKPTGTYEVTWYAEQLPSGVYFYQLKSGEYVSTKKMILLK